MLVEQVQTKYWLWEKKRRTERQAIDRDKETSRLVFYLYGLDSWAWHWYCISSGTVEFECGANVFKHRSSQASLEAPEVIVTRATTSSADEQSVRCSAESPSDLLWSTLSPADVFLNTDHLRVPPPHRPLPSSSSAPQVNSKLLNLEGGPRNWHHFLRALTSSNINLFSKLFHRQN